MSRSRDLARNTFLLSFGTFLPKIAAVISIPIITAHLTKVEYGTFDLISTLVALLLPVVTFQIHSAAFRFLIDCRDNIEEKKRVITNLYIFLIFVSTLTLIVLFLCLDRLKWSTRLLVVLYFLADILIVATQQVVRGLSNNKLFSISSIVQSFSNMLLIVLTVQFANKGLDGVLLSFTVATFLSLLLLIIKSNIYKEIDIGLFSSKIIKQMLSYSWPMIPNTLSNWVLSASDRLVLSAFMGIEAVAVYGAANKIPALFTSVQGTFIFAWQENASLALSDNDVEKYYSDMFDNIFGILSGIMAVLIGATPILFKLLIRGDYKAAYPQMPILFMGIFFSALSSFLGGIYIAHKRTKNVGITTLIAAAVNLVVDLTMVRYIGIYAASVSTLISYTLLAIYRMHDVRRFQFIFYNYKKICCCITVLCSMCFLCWLNTRSFLIFNFLYSVVFAWIINKKIIVSMGNMLAKRLSH